MEKNYQDRLFTAMKKPEFYPHPVTALEEKETHISKVFLTGPFVYKVKKPVDMGFLDFTTLEKRKHFCQREVTLNRRLTSDVYLKVVPVTLEKEGFALYGRGRIVEYAVKMRQLPDEKSMRFLLREGGVDKKALEKLALFLVDFYNRASTTDHISGFGTEEKIWFNWEENFRQTEKFGTILNEQRIQDIRRAVSRFMDRHRELFALRRKEGRIRDCHGDLRTGHIYFTDKIQVIDCIEFNSRFRYSDTASDLAFLVMDLEYEGHSQIAVEFLRTYITHSRDLELFILLNFYKCYRAYVRAKVNCFRLQGDKLSEKERDQTKERIRRYMELACHYAARLIRPALFIFCGLPATGKTTLAKKAADILSVKVFRSDSVRKELFDVERYTKMDVPFREGIYSQEATALTYGKLLMLGGDEIKKGRSVIMDASFGHRHFRNEALRLAEDNDAGIIFVECTAPESTIKSRLRERETSRHISDARLHHFEMIKNHFDPLDEVSDETHVYVNTEFSLAENIQKILFHLYT